MASFATRARKNELSLDEITGGTFTISNGGLSSPLTLHITASSSYRVSASFDCTCTGVYGSLMGTPIINSPQSAILGMHAVKERPVAIKNKVVIRPMMYVALTYDHRVVNGQEAGSSVSLFPFFLLLSSSRLLSAFRVHNAVTYLKTVKEIIEDPSRILLDL